MQHNRKQLGVVVDGKEFVAIALTVIKKNVLNVIFRLVKRS